MAPLPPAVQLGAGLRERAVTADTMVARAAMAVAPAAELQAAGAGAVAAEEAAKPRMTREAGALGAERALAEL